MEAQRGPRDESPTLADVLATPGTNLYLDLADRLAYVQVMGGFPSHGRSKTTRLMREATVLARGAGLSGDGGIKVREEVVRVMRLDTHPMMVTARRLMSREFRVVRLSFTQSMRRRCDRILLGRADGARVYVQSDGSILGDGVA